MTIERKIINPELQQRLDDADATHIIAIDKDTVKCMVDDEWQVFTRFDAYSGHPLSGYAYYGPVSGDHRMIRQIAEDMETVFKLLT